MQKIIDISHFMVYDDFIKSNSTNRVFRHILAYLPLTQTNNTVAEVLLNIPLRCHEGDSHMGKDDNIMYSYMSNKEHFADLFNGILFQGRSIIRPEQLSEDAGQYVILQPSGKHSCKSSQKASCHTPKSTHLSRDVKMSLKSGEVLRILAVENQNAVDYTMPLRCMEYDVMEYKKQLEALKRINRSQKTLVSPAEFLCGIRVDDRLAPVYTICLYHGEEEWDGPKSLADMMKFGEDSDMLYPLFADYPFRLFCINAQTDFRMFHTELRVLFMALNQRNSPEGLQKLFTEESAYQHLSKDTAEALAILLNMPQIWDFRNEYENQSEEDYDMCYAVKKWHEQDKMEGIVLGRNEGILDKTRIVVKNMLKRGFADDDIASLADCELPLIEEVRKQMADC